MRWLFDKDTEPMVSGQVYMWCACGVHVVYMWCTCGVHVWPVYHASCSCGHVHVHVQWHGNYKLHNIHDCLI